MFILAPSKAELFLAQADARLSVARRVSFRIDPCDGLQPA